MTAQGNDYVYADARKNGKLSSRENGDFAKKISDRRFGVGGDGFVLIEKSDVADAKMVMFNSDGSRGKICGSALRCTAHYLSTAGGGNYYSIETDCGVKGAFVSPSGSKSAVVCVGLGRYVVLEPPFGVDEVLEEELREAFEFCRFVNVGNEHLVVGLKNKRENARAAKAVADCNAFKKGINVHFCVDEGKTLFVESYERGSGFTFACGSGSVAVAAAYANEGKRKERERIIIRSRGGQVKVLLTNGEGFLTGDTEFVFEGEYYER